MTDEQAPPRFLDGSETFDVPVDGIEKADLDLALP